MEVLDAVDVVGGIHGEGYPVQTAVTHHAGEAVRVVGLSCRPQDALHDGLAADIAGLQGVLGTNTQLDNKPNEDRVILSTHLQLVFKKLSQQTLTVFLFPSKLELLI